MITLRRALRTLTATALAAACLSAWSDDAAIRKAWAERNPKAAPIDEITKTPMPGLYELRIGGDIAYSDERGDYLIFASRDQSDGHLIDTKARADLTEQRYNKLMAMDVPKLPFADAIMIKQGTGARRLVVFEDPNCHFCKDVEKSLVALKDVTIYTFLIPILGQDSVTKSRDIWCAKDNAKTWRSWMLSGVMPAREMGTCDASPLKRNVALAERYRVNGTPAIIFEDGSRFAGAVDLERLQKQLDAVAAATKKG
jgi:thiol:disulfide interchange protein DsbC